jgi:hypothetical protein
LEGEKPGFSEKPGFFPRTIEMIRLRRTKVPEEPSLEKESKAFEELIT